MPPAKPPPPAPPAPAPARGGAGKSRAKALAATTATTASTAAQRKHTANARAQHALPPPPPHYPGLTNDVLGGNHHHYHHLSHIPPAPNSRMIPPAPAPAKPARKRKSMSKQPQGHYVHNGFVPHYDPSNGAAWPPPPPPPTSAAAHAAAQHAAAVAAHAAHAAAVAANAPSPTNAMHAPPGFLEKRRALCKRAMELSTQFGVEVGLVVLNPNGGGMLEYASRGMEALLPRFHRFRRKPTNMRKLEKYTDADWAAVASGTGQAPAGQPYGNGQRRKKRRTAAGDLGHIWSAEVSDDDVSLDSLSEEGSFMNNLNQALEAFRPLVVGNGNGRVPHPHDSHQPLANLPDPVDKAYAALCTVFDVMAERTSPSGASSRWRAVARPHGGVLSPDVSPPSFMLPGMPSPDMAPILPQSMGGAVKRARPAVGKARKKNAAAAAAQAPAMAPAAMTNGGGHAQVPNGTPPRGKQPPPPPPPPSRSAAAPPPPPPPERQRNATETPPPPPPPQRSRGGAAAGAPAPELDAAQRKDARAVGASDAANGGTHPKQAKGGVLPPPPLPPPPAVRSPPLQRKGSVKRDDLSVLIPSHPAKMDAPKQPAAPPLPPQVVPVTVPFFGRLPAPPSAAMHTQQRAAEGVAPGLGSFVRPSTGGVLPAPPRAAPRPGTVTGGVLPPSGPGAMRPNMAPPAAFGGGMPPPPPPPHNRGVVAHVGGGGRPAVSGSEDAVSGGLPSPLDHAEHGVLVAGDMPSNSTSASDRALKTAIGTDDPTFGTFEPGALDWPSPSAHAYTPGMAAAGIGAQR